MILKQELCVSLMLTTLIAVTAAAEDWPQFRGPRQDGVSTETGINKDWTGKPPKVLWSCALTDNGFGGPCVADGKVFIIDNQNKEDLVRCLDVGTGKELWRFAYPGAPKDRFGFTGVTPAVDHGKVYTISRMGLVHCLEADTGKLVWKKDLIADLSGKRAEWDMNVSPVVDGERLLVVPGGAESAVAALNKATGETLWKSAGSEPGYATPLVVQIDGQKEYLTFIAEGLVGWKPEDGQRLWSVPWKTAYKQNAATPVVLGGNRVFISSAHNVGCALVEVKDNKPTILWKNKSLLARFTSPILYQGSIYGTCEPGDLVCIDPGTGEQRWKKAGFEFGPLTGVDGAIIAVDGKNGDVILAEANEKEFKELGRMKPLEGPVWTAPVIANGKLLLRNKKILMCVELKNTDTQAGAATSQPKSIVGSSK